MESKSETRHSGDIAKLLFPLIDPGLTPEFYESKYPERALPGAAMVTRFGPSPTGYMHIGGIYVSLINWILAKRSGGVFFLRIEDTDTKRSVPDAISTVTRGLDRFGLSPDEGVINASADKVIESGPYGPYIQSQRLDIYRSFAASLVNRGLAYPCFCTEDALDELRESQKQAGMSRPGYYGRWATCRGLDADTVAGKLMENTSFAIRFRSTGDHAKRILWSDAVRGEISMPENDVDVILLKGNGVPTYHFAHAIDDHLMRTTHVIRADEWLSSVPLHLQLFQSLGWNSPTYAHIPPIEKVESRPEVDESGKERIKESRRKLSKRKDPEANIRYYFEMGFPEEATVEYLLNLFDSSFENWRLDNSNEPFIQFPFSLESLASHGALSDMAKISSISKEVIARMDIMTLYNRGVEWAKDFDQEIATLMRKYPDYTIKALNIERTGDNPGKRIKTWLDLRPQLALMFDETFSETSSFEFPENMSEEDIAEAFKIFIATYDPKDSKDEWFSKIKAIAKDLGFAENMKAFKKTPGSYKGHVGDVAMAIRVALCGSRHSPDLWEVMQVMGTERVESRLSRFS